MEVVDMVGLVGFETSVEFVLKAGQVAHFVDDSIGLLDLPFVSLQTSKSETIVKGFLTVNVELTGARVVCFEHLVALLHGSRSFTGVSTWGGKLNGRGGQRKAVVVFREGDVVITVEGLCCVASGCCLGGLLNKFQICDRAVREI